MKVAARMSLRMRSHIKSQNYVGQRSFIENESAIYFLGITNATPKKIVEHMKVPGLTREQVASHLQRQENNLVVRTSLSHGADVSFNGVSTKRGTFEAASVTNGVTENPSPQAAMPSLLGSDNTEEPSVGFIQGRGWTSMLYWVGLIPRARQLPGREQNDVLYQPQNQGTNFLVQNSLYNGADVSVNGVSVTGGTDDVTSVNNEVTVNPSLPHAAMPCLDPTILSAGSADVSNVTRGVTEKLSPAHADVHPFLESENAVEISARFIESCLENDEIVAPPQQNEDVLEHPFSNDLWLGDEDSSWLMDVHEYPSAVACLSNKPVQCKFNIQFFTLSSLSSTTAAARRLPFPRERPRTSNSTTMLFFSYFKEIVGREVVVELKNDLAIRGTLRSVDQYLNIKLENTKVVEQDKYPHMLSVRNCFIRGSVVRYVQLPPDGVDVELLHDATRREARGG
ncbi:hypothetical protein Droror1_Dr00009614 [Drosera rotundifolia]